jgi:hypothetical protein
MQKEQHMLLLLCNRTYRQQILTLKITTPASVGVGFVQGFCGLVSCFRLVAICRFRLGGGLPFLCVCSAGLWILIGGCEFR